MATSLAAGRTIYNSTKRVLMINLIHSPELCTVFVQRNQVHVTMLQMKT